MSRKIELGFDYADGKHIPTIKISFDPCGPDGLAWDERDMWGKHIKKLLANHSEEPLGVEPVVERQPVVIAEIVDYIVQSPHPRLWYGPELGAMPIGTKLYTAPPELAELQATIARLETQVANALNLDFERRTEIERLRSAQSGDPSP